MLRVIIEYVPGGDTSRAETLARINISNSSNLAAISNYVVRLDDGPPSVLVKHDRSRGFWPLVCRAVKLATHMTSGERK